MFKKKSLLSEFSHRSGSCSFLSASLIFSLSSETAYSAPPIKNSAGYVIFSGEAPELPGSEELGATGITITDVTENATVLDASFAGHGITYSVTFPSESAPQPTETNDSTPFVPYGTSNAPLLFQDPMLPECPDSPNQAVDATNYWQANFAMLLSELDSDPADGKYDTFPAPELVNPWLQEMELGNVSPNDALLSIETSPVNYTVIDLYYVLWFIAKLYGERNLMKALCLNTLIIKRHLYLHNNTVFLFHKLSGSGLATTLLLQTLASLRSALNRAIPSHETMTQFIFTDLYNFVHSQAADAFVQEVDRFNGPLAIYYLTFLYELDQVSAQLFDGNNYVESNNIAYARSRAWFFIFGQFSPRKQVPEYVSRHSPNYLASRRDLQRYLELDRNLYSAYKSLTALFTLFLGRQALAYNMLERLACSNRSFQSDYYLPDMNSIVRWVVDGSLRMFKPPERDRIIRALSLMARNPFPSSPLHRTPDTVRSAGRPEVLEALEEELKKSLILRH
ncbi:hypothetical protein [Endozoicomonas sp. 4G]|uniref:hypothetical protein n=1 Tax=Endozoicomonas sp. 4G TaxID=2872754 RepID=UPI002078FD9C|nr:hypothetical protein [Endozoicomonas sp. 4G]